MDTKNRKKRRERDGEEREIEQRYRFPSREAMQREGGR
jgi:hypothetical protein